MVPFIEKVPFVVSQPTLRYSDLITVTVAGAGTPIDSDALDVWCMTMTHEILRCDILCNVQH